MVSLANMYFSDRSGREMVCHCWDSVDIRGVVRWWLLTRPSADAQGSTSAGLSSCEDEFHIYKVRNGY